MRSAVRIYRSYEDFERDELRRLERLSVPLEDLLTESGASELDADLFQNEEISGRARRSGDDGND